MVKWEQDASNLEIELLYTEGPRDTRPQAAQTLTMHVFELVPKKIEMHVSSDKLLLEMHLSKIDDSRIFAPDFFFILTSVTFNTS